MKKFFGEFKKFITRGSVLDLAVGVIIGSAFTSIVTALTNGVLMPLIGALTGGIDLSGLRIPLWNATKVLDESGNVVLDNYGQVKYSSAIYYGQFLQAIINFLLVALVLFIIIKIVNHSYEKVNAKKLAEEKKAAEEKAKLEELKKQEEASKPVVLSPTEQLLVEIRDLLQKEAK